MAWVDESGRHEGHVGMLFVDGSVGTGWSGGRVTVTVGPGGQALEFDQWQYRADVDVVAWLPRCGCGWSGLPWIRSTTPGDFDPVMRVAYSPDSMPPAGLEDGAMFEAWQAHAVPLAGLGELAAAHTAAGRRLDDAVLSARASGASWAQIGDAVGISRQSAHERWSRQQPH